MRGKVKWYNAEKRFGFIGPIEGGPDVFVHASALEAASLKTLEQGQEVEYELVDNRGKKQAANLKIKQAETGISSDEPAFDNDDLDDQDTTVTSKELIKEVAEWKLDAKSQDNDRYFFHVKEVSRIENGAKCYVIGRKGSGKTAISEYLGRLLDHDTFAEKLTFKNFPFNELYLLTNKSFTSPNQYITLWKYLIYSSICRLMARNAAIDASLSQKLKELYHADESVLSRRVSKWVGKEFSVGIFGLSIKIAGHSEDRSKYDSWIERVNVLEDIIRENIDSARYFIIFDELDEDYRNIIEQAQYDHYAALVTSLSKAVQDVKVIFKDHARYRIFRLFFLEMIYTRLYWTRIKINGMTTK